MKEKKGRATCGEGMKNRGNGMEIWGTGTNMRVPLRPRKTKKMEKQERNILKVAKGGAGTTVCSAQCR